jgi:hypothetical protein
VKDSVILSNEIKNTFAAARFPGDDGGSGTEMCDGCRCLFSLSNFTVVSPTPPPVLLIDASICRRGGRSRDDAIAGWFVAGGGDSQSGLALVLALSPPHVAPRAVFFFRRRCPVFIFAKGGDNDFAR